MLKSFKIHTLHETSREFILRRECAGNAQQAWGRGETDKASYWEILKASNLLGLDLNIILK
jgi:hypothetical protein